MDRAALEGMAERRRPGVVARAPRTGLMRDAFLVIAGLPNPATVPEVAHWAGLDPVMAKRAVERLVKAGLVEPAGRVVRLAKSWQTYQVAACGMW